MFATSMAKFSWETSLKDKRLHLISLASITRLGRLPAETPFTLSYPD